MIAGLRPTELTATAVFDGPIDGVTFRAYVEQVLVPTLRRGDVVVMDNLAVHKDPEMEAGSSRCECTVDSVPVVAQPGRFYGGWVTPEVVGPFKGEPGAEGW